MIDIIDFCFGCTHANYSWPQKYRNGAYVACLQCGSEFHYCTREMKVLGRLRRTTHTLPEGYKAVVVERLVNSARTVAERRR